MRAAMRSRRNSQLKTATTDGIEAITTPADTALVMLTPYNMQMENRKFPRKDSRNRRSRIRLSINGSSAGLRSHGSIARPPIPKRIQASRNTGMAATSGLESAT